MEEVANGSVQTRECLLAQVFNSQLASPGTYISVKYLRHLEVKPGG